MPDETITPELRALYARYAHDAPQPYPWPESVTLHPLGHGAPPRPAILNPDDSRTWRTCNA